MLCTDKVVAQIFSIFKQLRVDYQQRVLKRFLALAISAPTIGQSEYGIYWLICMQLTISSCYGSICLTLVLIGSDGGLSTLCYNCRFDYPQRVLKTFPGPAISTPRMRLSDYVIYWQICVYSPPFHLAAAQSL